MAACFIPHEHCWPLRLRPPPDTQQAEATPGFIAQVFLLGFCAFSMSVARPQMGTHSGVFSVYPPASLLFKWFYACFNLGRRWALGLANSSLPHVCSRCLCCLTGLCILTLTVVEISVSGSAGVHLSVLEAGDSSLPRLEGSCVFSSLWVVQELTLRTGEGNAQAWQMVCTMEAKLRIIENLWSFQKPVFYIKDGIWKHGCDYH